MRFLPDDQSAMLRPRWHSRISASRLIGVPQRGFQCKTGAEKHKVANELHQHESRLAHDLLVPSHSRLLDLILAPYLPFPPQPSADASQVDVLPPGHHFVYFPTSMSEQDTLEDGYETWFAPTRPFRRRLWTHGSLTFNPLGKPDGLEFGRWANCTEELVGGRGGTKRTVVHITRKMFHVGGPPAVIEERYMTYLHDSHATYVHEKGRTVKQDAITPQNIDTTPTLFRHTFTPSQFLFTRFAYLSHNFHRIHIDPEYATQIEGYPGPLMSASLSVIFLLTAFRTYFRGNGEHIGRAQYTLRRPLFVDRPVTLTLHRRSDGTTWALLWNDEEQIAVECIIDPSGMSM